MFSKRDLKKIYIDDYNQIQNILIQKFQFRRAEFKYNKGFNIIDHNTDHIYEIRILYAYYINQEKSIDDIKWRLYVDFLKMNVIASTFLLRKLMRSPYSNLLIKLCLKENVCDNNVVKSCIEKLSDVDNKKVLFQSYRVSNQPYCIIVLNMFSYSNFLIKNLTI